MIIKFEGPISVIQQNEDGSDAIVITSQSLLKVLDGREYGGDFSEYLNDGINAATLAPLNISSGKIGLVLKELGVHLYVTYIACQLPDRNQMQALWDETQGQLSDGVGPDFAGQCEDAFGLYPLMEPESVEITIDENT